MRFQMITLSKVLIYTYLLYQMATITLFIAGRTMDVMASKLNWGGALREFSRGV